MKREYIWWRSWLFWSFWPNGFLYSYKNCHTQKPESVFAGRRWIVFDSDAETEFEETVNKSKALIKAAKESIHFFGD